MEETIKSKEVIAYKGMKSDMTCKGFHYEVGKTYKIDKVNLCECGFHACLNPRDVFGYYPKYHTSRYFKVKLSGEIAKCDFYNTKVAATEMTILEEITDTFNEVIKTEWWKSENVLDFLYFSDGFAVIQREDELYNLIDKQGKILSEQWFEWVCNFYDGFARVQRSTDELWNFIDKQGKFLSDEWFSDTYYLDDGFARVKRTNGKWCQIDKTGKLIKILQ